MSIEGIISYNPYYRVNPELVAPRRAVPSGFDLTTSSCLLHAGIECLSTERRLQVMKNCLAFIFDGQISEARKVCIW